MVGKSCEATRMLGDKIVAIGNAKIREKIQEKLNDVVTLIRPDVAISRRVKIGNGCVAMAGAVINSDTVIGKGCMINTGASVDHDCRVGDYSHVSVGAHVAGTVEIGSGTWIGAGATISNNVNICSDCMIGAGAVVIKDIKIPGTYIGVSAEDKMSKTKLTMGDISTRIAEEHVLSLQHRRAA